MTVQDCEDLVPTYATPEDVAETLDLPDLTYDQDTYGQMTFSDTSHPSRRQVCKMILANEDIIDRRLHDSWRENRVVNKIMSIQTYWRDTNALRTEYFVQGGDYLVLRRGVREWNPSKGDKLEMRMKDDSWIDLSGNYNVLSQGDRQEANLKNNSLPQQTFWIDYDYGKLYLRTYLTQNRPNGIRISYRYGSTDPVPYAINRLCCLMTAMQVINMQVFNIKVGMGGDIGGVRNSLLAAWTDEINQILSSYQKTGSVRSINV